MHVYMWLAHLDIRIDQNTPSAPPSSSLRRSTWALRAPNEMSGSATDRAHLNNAAIEGAMVDLSHGLLYNAVT